MRLVLVFYYNWCEESEYPAQSHENLRAISSVIPISDREMANQQSYLPYMTNSLAIRQEIQRFESVHPSIYAIYDLIELVPDPLLAQQIREHVVCIEGRNEFFSPQISTLSY